ncbi:TetR/AcrR family transcriptional regulator [Paraburkholderia dipogonis]|uniref:TetR/AcrR family transcriptional regulator n=1 Tax=Paraburkholderia dipogonis TaxID=1211383 RepID=A0A4Y8MGC6_9BURK|nr:TetR/AcrR family transcriptional regulator [Paraburkholderia dipogonis]TFE36512.1 TetR/AcrR family transcriptional regulator [Paraburkholderia dipogonis]
MASRTSSYQRIMGAALRLFAERGTSEVTVSDLAAAAGVARGTVYAHLSSTQSLFENVASELAGEMHERVSASSRADSPPTLRLAEGIRFFIRRAHEEPQWGRFIVRFAFTEKSLQGLWSGPPVRDLIAGIEAGLYSLRPEQLPSSVAMMAGSVLGAMLLVLEGHKSWREASSDTAELVLRAFGVASDEARSIATAELPQLLSSTPP